MILSNNSQRTVSVNDINGKVEGCVGELQSIMNIHQEVK
jgi:hypothetical protein